MFDESDNSRKNSPKGKDGGHASHAHRDNKSSAGIDASDRWQAGQAKMGSEKHRAFAPFVCM
jgi:hypothetical protein